MERGRVRRLAWLAGGDGAPGLGACSAHAAGAGSSGGSNPGGRRPQVRTQRIVVRAKGTMAAVELRGWLG